MEFTQLDESEQREDESIKLPFFFTMEHGMEPREIN